MYGSEFRNKIYEDRHGAPLWASLEHKNNTISVLSELISQDVNGKSFLDYGCGDGEIGRYFLEKGADLDFAEISDKMVELLKQKYLYKANIFDTIGTEDKGQKVHVYKVETPNDIPSENSYDYIISRCVFHHIDPKMRRNFLDGLLKLLKKDGKLIISGRDTSDEISKQDGNIGHITGKRVRHVDELPQYLDLDVYEIKGTEVFDDKTPAFDTARRVRYFVIKHK